MSTKLCRSCNKEKQIPNEIYNASRICYECSNKEKKRKLELKRNGIFEHNCKDCGILFQTKISNKLICEECADLRRQNKDSPNSICTKCKRPFLKTIPSRMCICDDCKKELEEAKKSHTTCVECRRKFRRDQNFNIRMFTCDECSKKIQQAEEYRKTYRTCQECLKDKLIGKEISYKGFFCFVCVRKRKKERYEKYFQEHRKFSWPRICPDCGETVITTKPRATVVYCEECRTKKKQLRKDKKLKEMNRMKYDYCQICKTKTINDERKDRNIVCPNCRSQMKEFKKSHLVDSKYFKTCNKCNEKFEVTSLHFWEPQQCKKCANHKQPNDNRHKYGYQGKCSDGHKYQSLNEMDFDEWLTERKIRHEPHPRLKPTYRASDYYLPDYDKYVEIDGLGREDDVDWYGKLSIYEKLGIKPLIVTPVSKHFIENKEVCFNELDQKVLPIL